VTPPTEILEFWFADALRSPAAAAERNAFWFRAGPTVDHLIWERYGDLVVDAAAGRYDDWAATAQGRLALILVLDQFPRNIYRGTAEVFRFDRVAMSLAEAGVKRGHLAGLAVPEQAFMLMPFQHSEDIDEQRAGVKLMEGVVAEAAPEWRPVAQGYADYAVLHHDIIAQFGRFPHRNQVLGRASTPAEMAYMAAGGETFGQAG
jgi:uncharacterized protein (DUF924 family)